MIQSPQPDDPNLQYSFSSECLSFSAAHHHKWKMLVVVMVLGSLIKSIYFKSYTSVTDLSQTAHISLAYSYLWTCTLTSTSDQSPPVGPVAPEHYVSYASSTSSFPMWNWKGRGRGTQEQREERERLWSRKTAFYFRDLFFVLQQAD